MAQRTSSSSSGVWASSASRIWSVPASLSKNEAFVIQPSKEPPWRSLHAWAQSQNMARENPGTFNPQASMDSFRQESASPARFSPWQANPSCLGCGAAPSTGRGVNEWIPFPIVGWPICSKGCFVPRPTLMTVGSNRHRLGYKSMDVRVGKLGLGRMANGKSPPCCQSRQGTT